MLDFTAQIDELSRASIDDACFEVMEKPLKVDGYGEIPKFKALFRGDTNQLLHVHNESYTVLSNETVINAQYDAIKKANISGDFDFNVTSLDDGRKLKVEVLFNDIVTEPEVGDYVKFRATAFNSYDGSWAYQNQTDGLRLWCTNGCTSADTIARIWARHTTNLNISSTVNQIERGLHIFQNQKELWDNYRSTKINVEQAHQFFKTDVVPVKSKAEELAFNKKQVNILIEQLSQEMSGLGRNKWALYNCLTHWASHTGGHKIPEAVTRDREQIIARAINSRAWAELG